MGLRLDCESSNHRICHSLAYFAEVATKAELESQAQPLPGLALRVGNLEKKLKMFTTYVLKSESLGTHYVGYSSQVEVRLIWHNEGKSRYTKNRGPWKLVYSERYETKSEAKKLESFLKTGKDR